LATGRNVERLNHFTSRSPVSNTSIFSLRRIGLIRSGGTVNLDRLPV